MKIAFYLPTFNGSPLNLLWKRGWAVQYGFEFLGIDFIRYSNSR